MRALVVVDMQKDFIDGALGTKEAKGIVEGVKEEIRTFDGKVFYTMDTHTENYLESQEGRNLPVKHCIRGTEGWKIPEEIESLLKEREAAAYEKGTFGSRRLAEDLFELHETEGIERIVLIGLCTDICVISNALLFKAFLPEVPIEVKAHLSAGVTPEKHLAAMETLRSCQVHVSEE